MIRLRQRVGRRGAALLFFAFLDLVYCWSLLDPPRSTRGTVAYAFLASILPLWAWGLMWGAVGVVCLICAFLRHDEIAYTAAISVKVLWGSLFTGAWLFASMERGYVSAAVWLALALLVALIAGWPEPPRKP